MNQNCQSTVSRNCVQCAQDFRVILLPSVNYFMAFSLQIMQHQSPREMQFSVS